MIRKEEMYVFQFLAQTSFRIHEEMVVLDLQYFTINRILLRAIGLWPFHRTKLVQFQLILLFGILLTFILFQLTPFLTFECNTDFVIKVMSSVCFFTCFAITYNSFCVNMDTISHLMKLLQCTCNDLKNENEITIIKKYGRNAKFYTTVITLFAICSLFSAIFLQVWVQFRYIIRSSNESSAPIYFMTEYFIDREKYFYLIMLHGYAALCIGGVAMLATGTMLLTYGQHACGMFSIASFRIEQAMTTTMLHINQKNHTLISKKIGDAVDMHRKAMNFCNFLVSNFEGSFFFLILVGLVCMASSLVQILSSIGDIQQLVLPFIIILVNYVYLFLSNFVAQEVIDHNNRLFDTVYNVQWYAASVHIQKIILFLLQRGSKPFNLNLGGLFIGSMESAASLLSTSISYFTVLYSTRQD